MNRLCIYALSDNDGVIDRFIPYWLEALSDYVTHYVIVCNGYINDVGKQILDKYTKDVFYRENVGFDAGAVKDVLENLYGWDKVYEYDELLICNDTFYGPFYPLSEMFNKMANRDVDFWGITEHAEYSGVMDTYPHHLQSYFINFNFKLLHSLTFFNFWKNLKIPIVKNELVRNYEVLLSEVLCKAGFKFKAYIDCTRFYSVDSRYNYNYYVHDACYIIKEHRCPIAKKHAFWNGNRNISAKGSERNNELMDEISSTGYDVNMIWDNLLRFCYISDIYDTLRLNFILDSKCCFDGSDDLSVLVIAHIAYEECVDECLAYLLPLNDIADIVVTTSNDTVCSKTRSNGLTVRKIENGGSDFDSLLIECSDLTMKYEFICFTHDTKSNEMTPSLRTADSFRYLLWENTLASIGYVRNVIRLFKNSPRLGYLGIPKPYHSRFLSSDFLCNNFRETVELLNKLKIDVPINEGRSPISIGTAFWCRSKALKALFEYSWKRTDFPPEPISGEDDLNCCIESVFPFVAQHEGYYSGTVMTSSYAAVRLMDFEHMLRDLLYTANQIYPITDQLSLRKFPEILFISELKSAVVNVSKIYIYGAGIYGKRVDCLLKSMGIDYFGFIVSDGQQKQTNYCRHKVFHLSEIEFDSDSLVIVALGKKYVREVVPGLEKMSVRLLRY